MADIAVYLQACHEGGAAPATIRVARAAIAKAHRVSGFTDPTTGNLCRDVLRRIGREGRDRGRGQVAGVGWTQAEAAARLAEDDGTLQGLRDGAIVRLMSDTLARISEVAALQCSDVEPDITTGGGTVHIRASKTDQRGDGSTRYIGPATLAATGRYLTAAGHTTGPLFRRVLRGGHSSAAPLRADSIRDIVRGRAAVVASGAGRIGGHSLRVGSSRDLAVAGASVAELQQAGGWRSPATPEVYIRREAAARGPVARRRYQVGAEARVPHAPVLELSLPDDFGDGRMAARWYC
ncbi:MAG: tyrosine-type recombinase/integrase [Spirochaetaceae bacterium]|nr:tyrosine-type recombinase/integrase [Spirochaetaceae bacterium]